MTITTRAGIVGDMQTPATVLVIEKHPLMRAAIVSAIADESDLTIAAIASDAGDTLQIVASLHPQIILFAIGNPGEEDLEMMRELHERFPDPVFVALTTSEVPGQEEDALAYGADAVLAKTAPRAELLHALRALRANSKVTEEQAESFRINEREDIPKTE
ncbi:MAG: response regulator transcription factor [Anaerolineales bacterium]|nr:response regulator transcription factor [Anaerolineales bacterium]